MYYNRDWCLWDSDRLEGMLRRNTGMLRLARELSSWSFTPTGLGAACRDLLSDFCGSVREALQDPSIDSAPVPPQRFVTTPAPQ